MTSAEVRHKNGGVAMQTYNDTETVNDVVKDMLLKAKSKAENYIAQAKVFKEDFGRAEITEHSVADAILQYDLMCILSEEEAIPAKYAELANKLQGVFGYLIGLDSGKYRKVIESRGIQVLE